MTHLKETMICNAKRAKAKVFGYSFRCAGDHKQVHPHRNSPATLKFTGHHLRAMRLEIA